MEVELKGIKRCEVSTSSLFTGSSTSPVIELEVTFLEEMDGMFYLGDWSGIPKIGKTVFVNIKSASESEAVYNMQHVVSISNVDPIPDGELRFQLVRKELSGETTVLHGSIYSTKQDAVKQAKILDRTGGDHRVRETKVFGPINFKCNE